MQADNTNDNQRSHIRRLEITDKHKGFLELLRQLTVCEDVGDKEFDDRFQEFSNEGDHHVECVIEDGETGRVVATGSVYIEKKFARSCGLAAHIEDVVVDAGARGRNSGKKKLLNISLNMQSQLGASTKVILDCSVGNRGFSEKCGFEHKAIQMSTYFS